MYYEEYSSLETELEIWFDSHFLNWISPLCYGLCKSHRVCCHRLVWRWWWWWWSKWAQPDPPFPAQETVAKQSKKVNGANLGTNNTYVSIKSVGSESIPKTHRWEFRRSTTLSKTGIMPSLSLRCGSTNSTSIFSGFNFSLFMLLNPITACRHQLRGSTFP